MSKVPRWAHEVDLCLIRAAYIRAHATMLADESREPSDEEILSDIIGYADGIEESARRLRVLLKDLK